ncbi:hypothetical protein Tco_0281153 [Tanacetum coccineum]
MAFFVISVSLNSSKESVVTSTAQVILFGTIPTTIPPTTPTTHLPVIQDDTLLTPTISPTIPLDPYETVVAQWRSCVAACSSPPSLPIRHILPAPPGLPRKPAVLVLPGQPIPMVDLIVPSPIRSPTSPIRGALSLVRANLSPPPKRIRDFDLVTDMEVGLRVDSKDSCEPYIEPDTDSDIQENIDECIAYADAIRARGMDDRDVVEIAAEEESIREDVLDHVIADRAMEVTYETLGGSGHRITGVDLEVTTMTERINALERDNTRLRGMLDVESQRVDQLQRSLSRA